MEINYQELPKANFFGVPPGRVEFVDCKINLPWWKRLMAWMRLMHLDAYPITYRFRIKADEVTY